MAYILKTDGTIEDGIKGAADDGYFTLAQLQEAVGGYIEAVPGSRNRAYCNEEGRLRGLPVNQQASQQFNQLLVGNVIVLEHGDKDGPDDESDLE